MQPRCFSLETRPRLGTRWERAGLGCGHAPGERRDTGLSKPSRPPRGRGTAVPGHGQVLTEGSLGAGTPRFLCCPCWQGPLHLALSAWAEARRAGDLQEKRGRPGLTRRLSRGQRASWRGTVGSAGRLEAPSVAGSGRSWAHPIGAGGVDRGASHKHGRLLLRLPYSWRESTWAHAAEPCVWLP